MQKEKIITTLDEWNFWNRELESGVLRPDYLEQLEKLTATGQVVFITGPRRSGKSTLIRQFMKTQIEGGADRKCFLYVNFEEPRFVDELSLEFLNEIYEAYLEIVKPDSKPCIFLDEVQNISGWEKFVRALHEKDNATLFVSGSSAKLLSKELGTVLTGRHVNSVVYPLSFGEFLKFRGLKLKNTLDVLSNKLKIKQLLREYLLFGGFPRVVLSSEKDEILREYFNDIIMRDVVQRYRIKKINKLKSLAKYYLTNISSLCSFRKIKDFIGISLDSVERYSYYLRDAYFIFFVRKFSYSLKEQEVNPRKVYSIDPGLRNVVGFRFSKDLGKLYENTVFLKLLRQDGEIYYFKDKGECDFLVKKDTELCEALQVCFNVTDENKKREVSGLLEAMEKFSIPNGTIITEGFEAEEEHKGVKVNFIPLWKWLLKEHTPVKSQGR